MSTVVEITDNISPAMAKAWAPEVELTLRAPVGEALVALFRQNFLSLGTNKHDWPTTHFWARAAAATSFEMTNDGLQLTVDQIGVRQRYEGGFIFPKAGHTFLTIPACAEAYGRRARDFSDLKFASIFTPDDHGLALVKAGSPAATTGQSMEGVMFWLSRGVRQDEDPDVLPAEEDIRATLIQTIQNHLLAN